MQSNVPGRNTCNSKPNKSELLREKTHTELERIKKAIIE